MLEIGFISAFIAGLLMFLAPCTLPLVPAYLGFISGVSAEDLKNKATAGGARRRIFLNGLMFIVGFSLVFILFGTLAGFLGQSLVIYRTWLARIGGGLVVIFGLFLMGVLDLSFLQSEKRIKIPKFLHIGRPSSSMVMGGAFAFGWTPCVGPILGSILLLASISSTAIEGAVLLAVFSLGLALPFLLIAALFSRATVYIEKISKYLNIISKVGGIFLVILGILLITNNFGILIEYGYKFFDFLNYDKILDYL